MNDPEGPDAREPLPLLPGLPGDVLAAVLVHLGIAHFASVLSACHTLFEERHGAFFALFSHYIRAAAQRPIGCRRCLLLGDAFHLAKSTPLDSASVDALMGRQQGLVARRAITVRPIRCNEVVLAHVTHTTDAGAFLFLPAHDGVEALISFSEVSGGQVRRRKVRKWFEERLEEQAHIACRVIRFDAEKKYADLACNALHRSRVVVTPEEETEARRLHFGRQEALMIAQLQAERTSVPSPVMRGGVWSACSRAEVARAGCALLLSAADDGLGVAAPGALGELVADVGGGFGGGFGAADA